MPDTILFDLDGTLLPLKQAEFVEVYFAELTRALGPLGYEPQTFIKALESGTRAMMENQGSRLNREVFWDRFAAMLGEQVRAQEIEFERFYEGPFDAARRGTKPRAPLHGMIRALRDKGYRVVLATNPVFPLAGVATRLGWVGLRPEDFDLVTSYENSRFCKPNPDYFRALFSMLGKAPSQCLMVGNDACEDMAARIAGAQVFLVTDYLEHAQGVDIDAYPHGRFDQLREMLDALPKIS